jgi:hypothetical protein
MSNSAFMSSVRLCLICLAAMPAMVIADSFEIAADVQGRHVVAATITPEYVACAAAIGQPARFELDVKSHQLWLVSESRKAKAEISDSAFQQWLAIRTALSSQQRAQEARTLDDSHIDQKFRDSLKNAATPKIERHAIDRPIVRVSAGAEHIGQLSPLERSLSAARAEIDALGANRDYIPRVFNCFLDAKDAPFTAHLAKKGAPEVSFAKRALANSPAVERLPIVPLWTMFASDPALAQSLVGLK